MSKTVLITGASSGFGEACAAKFAESGCSLLLMARRGDRLDSLRKRLESQCAIYCLSVDITDAQAVASAFSRLPDEFRDIDVLINNAGLALGLEPAHLADFSDWETMVETNIMGLLRMTHYWLPGMVRRNTGHVINIGSTAGSWPYPGGNVYGATKAFVQNFSRQLRADLQGANIRVTNIDPGLSETEFSKVRFKNDEHRADKVYENTKPLTAPDIADIIYWVTTVPSHVNINMLEVMPVCQSWSALSVDRNG